MAGAFLIAVLFFAGLAAKERDNHFCVACHLHDEKFQRLTAAASSDLAGFHHVKDSSVGCIECHGGGDLRMRFTVRGVAAFDTIRFLVGTYREPTTMRLALRDAECRRCHTPILKSAAKTQNPAVETAESFEMEAQTEGRGGTSYHAIREHGPVRVACVRCHTAHTTDSQIGRHFVSRTQVVPICRQCHQTM